MPRLIDGDNLLGTWPGRDRGDAAKRDLVRDVGALMRRDRGRRIVLVFDGPQPLGVSHGPDVVYAGSAASADAVILARLREERDPRGWIVVTNDRSLADRCRHLGARVESGRTFRERLSRTAAGDKPDEPGELQYWIDQFGGEEPESP